MTLKGWVARIGGKYAQSHVQREATPESSGLAPIIAVRKRNLSELDHAATLTDSLQAASTTKAQVQDWVGSAIILIAVSLSHRRRTCASRIERHCVASVASQAAKFELVGGAWMKHAARGVQGPRRAEGEGHLANSNAQSTTTRQGPPRDGFASRRLWRLQSSSLNSEQFIASCCSGEARLLRQGKTRPSAK